MPEPPLLAAGRDADVFDLGDGTVLRRYRRRPVPESEVEVMRYAHSQGYPVPAVISVSGPDLTLEKVEGPTMMEELYAGSVAIAEHAAALADLHRRLHLIAAPDWLPARAPGGRLLHLDLHPLNVIMSGDGPVVIDWANAAAGPAALDPAVAIAIFVSAKASRPPAEATAIDAFIRAFAGHFDADELGALLPQAFNMRRADPNVTDPERAALLSFRLPIT